VEQAKFRSEYIITDLIEKSTEYNIPIYLAFVVFKNAFECIETWFFLNALNNVRIETRLEVLFAMQKIYTMYEHATMQVKLNEYTKTDKIIKSRSTPKQFTLALEDFFKKLQWGQ